MLRVDATRWSRKPNGAAGSQITLLNHAQLLIRSIHTTLTYAARPVFYRGDQCDLMCWRWAFYHFPWCRRLMETTTPAMLSRSIGADGRWLYFSIELLQSGLSVAAKTRLAAQDIVKNEDDGRRSERACTYGRNHIRRIRKCNFKPCRSHSSALGLVDSCGGL